MGTYDGALFTVRQVDRPPPVRRPSAAERFKDEPKSACPEPEDGWPMPDPARRSERDLGPVTEAARAEPDFAGVWLSYLEPMGHNVAEEPGEFVLNVTFTSDLERHQAQLRSLWVDGCASRASSAPTASCWRSNLSCTGPLAPSLACRC